MSRLDFIYIIIGLYMSMFGITYLIIATAHGKIGHDPSAKVDYENFNIILVF